MFNFEHSYAKLPERFYAKAKPATFPNPELITFNHELASDTLGVDASQLSSQTLAKLFTGQTLPSGANPIALAYAGHQFGQFSPQLGDGRALLLGEIISPVGQRFDIQLKGAGPTPFSRNGDGKSALGPVIREYIVSEAMHFLGVPTTRALAAATTGENVYRDHILPGGVLTRVAASHIRVGTFEYFAAQGDTDAVKTLLRYTLERHYPDIDTHDILGFVKRVAHTQAELTAQWMSLGFIHGVMNTDNITLSGETLDYGPCAFMDHYSANRVFSFIDRNGRYAYNNQQSIAQWNLYRLLSCLLPFIHKDADKAIELAEESAAGYIDIYDQKWREAMAKKLGLFDVQPEDESLIHLWLQLLEDENLDFTQSFRQLSDPHCDLKNNPRFNDFFSLWKKRRQAHNEQTSIQLMKTVNPVFIPRNHQVERAIQSALQGDYSVFNDMNTFLKTPYVEQAKFSRYQCPPTSEEKIANTFCGT